MLNHLVWRYVCVSLISKRTGSHRPRKHKKKNDCNATSRTLSSALAAIFSSSPASFSRAVNIFEKCFFYITYSVSPCAPPSFCYALDTLTSHWSQNFPVMGWWRKNSNKRFQTSTEAAWTPAKFIEWFVQATYSAFLLISLIHFWTPVRRPAITAASSYACPLQFWISFLSFPNFSKIIIEIFSALYEIDRWFHNLHFISIDHNIV